MWCSKNDVVKNSVYKAKIKNIEDKISDITTLATNTALNTKTNLKYIALHC